MATEYIRKDAALACFTDWIDSHGHEHSADEMTEYQRIEELPEEDVRPVVLCRDCKHYNPSLMEWKCDYVGGLIEPDEDDFCSYGEADMRPEGRESNDG